jgi:hypothetical protein
VAGLSACELGNFNLHDGFLTPSLPGGVLTNMGPVCAVSKAVSEVRKSIF